MEAVAPQPLLILPLGLDREAWEFVGQLEGQLAVSREG